MALVLLAGSWLLVISPKRADATSVTQQAEGQVSTNQTLQTQLALLKQQKKELPQQQARLAELQTKVPQTPAMVPLIQMLNSAANRAGVDLTSLTPAAAVTVMAGGGAPADANGVLPANQLAAIDANIVVDGGYFEIEKFVNSLENLNRYLLVTNITIVKKESTDGATSASDAKLLTATLSSRVFLMPPPPEVTTTAPTTGVVPTTGAAPTATPTP